MDTVKQWTTRNDANHSNKHAEAKGIEFFAFPYQPFLSAHVNGHYALVSSQDSKGLTHVTIYKLLDRGESEPVSWESFQNSDAAFLWAAENLQNKGVQS